MSQLSPEGRGKSSPPPGKTLIIPSKPLAAYLKAHFTEQNTEMQGFQTPLWLSRSFPPVYSFSKHLFEHTVCSQLQTETGKPVMGVGAGPLSRDDKASVNSLPPPPAVHVLPLSLLCLRWESLSLSQIRYRPWGHASLNVSWWGREGFQEEEAKAWKARKHQPGTTPRLSQDTDPGRTGGQGVDKGVGASQVQILVVSAQCPAHHPGHRGNVTKRFKMI